MEPSQKQFSQLVIRCLLVLVPTILIGYVTLHFLNLSYTSLNTSVFNQAAYFAVGLFISYSLYYYGARMIPTFLLLWLVYWLAERSINKLPGEFDVFYATAKFQLYSTLFIFGWVFGFLLARVRWSYVILSGIIVTITLVSISDTIDISLSYILAHLLPVIVYGLYMFFLSPLLATTIKLTWKQGSRLAVRIVLFVLLIVVVLVVTEQLFRNDLKAVQKELAARGAKNNNKKDQKDKESKPYDDRYGLMEKDDDGYRLKDTMRVNTRMSQSDKLMFCSKLDNFFEDGKTPAPLYFVYHYLTRYDSVKESFTRDVNVPSFDEIEVDPTRLPVFYSYTDTSIVRKSMGDKFKKVVEAQVYLSENTWKHSVLGPASVFAIQTIPVEKDFQKTFLSGYKIYSYVSDLNNAYFVYNISSSPMLVPLQDERHKALRSVKNYNKVDKVFLDYYTALPTGGIYDSIAKLAHRLAPMSSAPVDKVLAVRDFFLKRNENGKRVFRYSLQAGAVNDPNIPSSKMLYNFLFKTHTGYCTYYAGASLFMLRSLGIPTRFTTGFAAVDRSSKNKGWYWFYASQAHAWTQVYFPEYGWMDFDMTIGNEDQQGAPRPDGTPPLPPPEPWLVLSAKVTTTEPVAKTLDISFRSLMWLNVPHALNKTLNKSIDATRCRVLYDKRDTTFAAIQPGDSIIVVSYKDDEKTNPTPREGISIEDQVDAFPSPLIADEIHIRGKEKNKKNDANAKKVTVEEKKMTWREIAVITAWTTGSIVVLLFLLPLLYLLYRLACISFAKSANKKTDQIYQAALYRFHMAGIERIHETPLDYAATKVDPQLRAGFQEFMRLYLRLKYSNGQLRTEDTETINRFANAVGTSIRSNRGFFTMILNYLNITLAWRYFQQPDKTDYETPSI